MHRTPFATLALAACAPVFAQLACSGSSGASSTTSGGSASATGAGASSGSSTAGTSQASSSAGVTGGTGNGASSTSSGSTAGATAGSTGGSGSASTSGGTPEVLDGLQVTSALKLSANTVAIGQTLSSTATLYNPTNAAIVLEAADIAARPPNGTNSGGPYLDLYDGPAVTIAAGQSFVLTGSRQFVSTDPLGGWYAYVTLEDSAGTFHDSKLDVTFTVVAAGGSTSGGSTAGSSASGGASTGSTGSSGGTSGGAPAGTVTLDASATGAAIVSTQFGSNLATWYDITQPNVGNYVTSLGTRIVRWPGGSYSDEYHWQTYTACDGAYLSPNSTFTNFMNDVVIPSNLEVAMTVNYGSNAACNAGGDPTEAAAWVAAVKTNGYNVHHWTVGNEVYGSWEYDLHAVQHDPTTYAAAVAGANGYYALMKAQDSTAQIGVVVDLDSAWDGIVLANAPYDYVELHNYTTQQPGSEDDSTLLTQQPGISSAGITTLRGELATAGKPNTPIMIGEFNTVPYSPGKQSVSIVNALYYGMVYGEYLNDGVQILTWFMAIGGGDDTANNSASLYGWQTFGSYNQISDGADVPTGTVFPTGNAAKLVSQFATPGNTMLTASVGSGLGSVQAYGATQGTGYAVMLFNLDESNSTTVTVALSNATRSSFTASTQVYDKSIYDQTQTNVWAGPTTTSLGTVGASVNLTLTPWSQTVLLLK